MNNEFELPEDPIEALREILSYYSRYAKQGLTPDSQMHLMGAVAAIVDTYELNIAVPNFSGDFNDAAQDKLFKRTIGEIRQFTDKKINKKLFESYKSHYMKNFGSAFSYEFSEGDIDRIQELITELRSIIKDDTRFSKNHRERLMKRLDSLQSELHKQMSNLDKIWGFMGEAGVAIGKFETDIKPFTDRIQEMLTITWRSQARAEELPSGMELPFITKEESIAIKE